MEAMRLEISPFMKRFYERGVTMTRDREVLKAERAQNQVAVTFRNMHTAGLEVEVYDHVIIEAGTLPNDEPFTRSKTMPLTKG